MALTWTTPAGSIGTYKETLPISFQFLTSSTDAGTVTYSLSSGYLPTGTTLSATGLLSGVPLTNNTDTAQVIWFVVRARLTKSDSSTEDVYETFNISIAPWLNWVTKAGSLGEYAAYSSLNIQLQTRIPPVQMSYVRYSLVAGALPDNVTLNTTTGVISGKPTTTDKFKVSTFSIKATGYGFSGIEVAQQTQQFSITVGMWATPPIGTMESNMLGPFTGGQPIHPVQFICSPGLNNTIKYEIIDQSQLALRPITATYNGVSGIAAAELVGLPEVVAADRQFSFTLRVTKQNSANVTVIDERRFVYVVLARSQPKWITPPGQVTTTITTTTGTVSSNNKITVDDPTNIVSGLIVTASSITQPTTVTSITGQVVTLSSNVTSNSSIPYTFIKNTHTEGTSFTHVFSAQAAVRGDIVNFELLNGSYPAGNLVLTQTANNTATLSGTLAQVSANTTTPFTIRAIEKNNTTVVGISDRTFDITVAGPTPPTFATITGMLGDMSTRYYADVPAASISNITNNGNSVVVSVAPYNLTNYGITNNTPIYIAGIIGGTATTLNKNMYYVSNADSSNSTFELCLNAGSNNTPTNPLTLPSITYTAGGTVGRVSLDSTYFETQIVANLNDPDVTAIFTLDSGLLPDGLELSTSGLISGYPTSKRTTIDDAGLPVYWGAVDVNGSPTTKLSTFTVRVTTQSGTSTAEYSIAILNQEAAWSLNQYLAGTSEEFPGRVPVLLNTRPLTQVISNTDPYFAYYSTDSNIGRYTQDNQLVYKMIGHNFNAGETESAEYGLTYTITGLTAGIADSANAFAPTIATFTANDSNVVMTTLNALGTTISFIGSNVGNTVLSNGDAANVNTYVGNTMKYYWSAVPNTVNTINLYTNKDTNIANVITHVVGDLVTPTANGTLQTLDATMLISPTSSNVAANGWINGTLGNIGTDINTYKFNVTVAAPNLVANINTTATISNYSSIILVGNTYGLTVGRQVNFTGNSVGNISNSETYTISTIADTVTLPATITKNSTRIAISDTTGLAVNSKVWFSDALDNIKEGTSAANNYTVTDISSGNTITATFAANTANILVDDTTSLKLNQPITLANTIDNNLTNAATYFVRSINNTIITSASTTGNTITVNSIQGLDTGANITVTSFTPRSYTKVVTATMTATPANYYANLDVGADANVYYSGNTKANYSGNLILIAPDATNINTEQYAVFSNVEFGNINGTNVGNSTTANVNTIYTVWAEPTVAGQARRKVTLVDLDVTFMSNATGSMIAKFIEPNAAVTVNTTANFYQVSSVSGSTITIVESANASNEFNVNTRATMTLTTAAKNNITISTAIDSNAMIKSTAALTTSATTRNPTITLANLTPNANGTLSLSYTAKHITVSSNGNVIIANASNTMSIYSTDHPPLVSGPHEYKFVMSGTINAGIGWSSPDGNLGTITSGSTSMLNIEATFGSDSIETTATITNGNANIGVVSAKSLLQGQPVTFTGNNVGNISNVATYYIKSNVTDTSTALTISRTLGGNVVTPNATGTMTLRSTVNDGRFKLVDGSLPPGLKLLSTGDIVGRVAFQPTENYQTANTATTYNFTVQAYSKKYAEITKEQEFSITTVQKYVEPYDNLYVSALINEDQRSKVDNLLVHISGTQDNSVTKNIYRSADVNFGVATGIKYGHMYGVSSKASGTFYEAYAAAIAKNHYYKNLTLGDLKTAVARDENGNIVYEVVYSPIEDSLVSSTGVSISKDLTWVREIVTERDAAGEPLVSYGTLVSPNSLTNMRQQVEDTIGRINNSDVLPLWMVTQQADGNVLGFVPCWVLCYTLPGKSSVVLSSISTYLADNSFSLNQVSFDMDRFEVDRALTYTYGGTTGDTWPELTATFTNGNTAIVVNNTVGLTNNQPVKFVGTAVEGVNLDATYWVSNVVANTIWVRNQQYGNVVSTALTPKANGTMTLSTVPKSTMVADDSQDTYVIFTQNNIIK
jgi:hypothetical protein